MNVTKTTRIRSIAVALTIPLVLVLFTTDAECAEAGQKSSDELLLDIMGLHSELVTNETFLAQAKMLGAYLEAAQPLEESKKINIYAKVLDILSKIKGSPIGTQAIAEEEQAVAEQKPLEEEKQEAKSVYQPGAALLEIFKIDPDKKEIPDLPVIRTYWKRDLAYSGSFLVPDRFSEVGSRSYYLAKFSFYYEAKQSGKYGFTILHDENNGCELKIGDVKIVTAAPKATSAQGVCKLEKGFHRVEFGLGSQIRIFFGYDKPSGTGASFEVKILTPGGFDAAPITKDMMLLKADQKKAGQVDRGRRAKRKPLPYIDY